MDVHGWYHRVVSISASADIHGTPAIDCDLVAERRRDAHTVRVPVEGRWEAFEANAKLMNSNPTKVLNAFLAWYNRDPSSPPPPRPGASEVTRSADAAPRD